MNPNIGSIDCPICHHPAHVRQYKERKKLDTEKGGTNRYAGLKYIVCPNGCGKITTSNQAYIDANATLTPVATEALPEPPPEPVGDDPLPPPEPEPTGAPVAPEEPEPAPEKHWSDEWL